MTVGDRIFAKLEEIDMTQKEFSEKTGIPQSTVSDWKKKKTNPTAEKIMIICKVLDVTPEWLLSGVEPKDGRDSGRYNEIELSNEAGQLIAVFNSMDKNAQNRLLGYAEALLNYVSN